MPDDDDNDGYNANANDDDNILMVTMTTMICWSMCGWTGTEPEEAGH